MKLRNKHYKNRSSVLMPAIFGGSGVVGPFNVQIVFDIILRIVRNIVSYVGLIAVVMLVIAGIILIANGADESSRERAKKIVFYTIIGIIIILLSSAIVNFVVDAFN